MFICYGYLVSRSLDWYGTTSFHLLHKIWLQLYEQFEFVLLESFRDLKKILYAYICLAWQTDLYKYLFNDSSFKFEYRPTSYVYKDINAYKTGSKIIMLSIVTLTQVLASRKLISFSWSASNLLDDDAHSLSFQAARLLDCPPVSKIKIWSFLGRRIS